jgi:hypothetical protein
MSRVFLAALCALLLPLAGCDIVPEREALAAQPPVQLAGPAPRRCPDCARIVAKREILPLVADTGALQVFEYTVRMADGSSRVFRETLPTSWRLHERLGFIDGSTQL